MSYIARNTFEEVSPTQIDLLIRSANCCVLLDQSIKVDATEDDSLFKFSRLIGIGIKEEIAASDVKSLSELRQWLSDANDYVFGYFSYDIKNLTENLNSSNSDKIGFPNFHFFIPETLIVQSKDQITVLSHLDELDFSQPAKSESIESGIQIETMPESAYVSNVRMIKDHIQFGDVYELNYCLQHEFENIRIDPFRLYSEHQRSSPAPFSCYVADNGRFLISSSPERFMKKTGSQLISQPMKGTNRKVSDNESQKEILRNDPKEVSENVMITDLVRNDLSRSAKKGTVKVDELCGVYEFPHVNQMISTVSAELKENTHPLDAILNAFPMGSMTGAPKISAMKLIDRYEDFSRGLYSGSVGYFTPGLDFDFNVVIRSLLYNRNTRALTYPTGGAITINSDPIKEYEECMLKAEAMRKVVLNHAK